MIRIEKMTKNNVSGVARLEKENFSDGWSIEALSDEIDNPDACYLVAINNDDEVCASAGFIQSFDTADIMNVSVDEKHRRQGIAKSLLFELLKEGKSRGIKKFTLEVREGNAPARNLYESFGFVNEGIRPDFYSNPKEGAVIYWLR